MTDAVRERVERQTEATRRTVTSDSTARSTSLPVLRVKVRINVIHGSHKRERRITKDRARGMFRILKAGYAGAQSTTSDPMGVAFDLKRIRVIRNDTWYHAKPMSRADKRMKRELHRGTASMLNIYVNEPKFAGGGVLLGYSRFPWQYRYHKRLDGVTVNAESLPGGRVTGYNRGDTVVHETGHWFGLLHTFQNGCFDNGDGVADTPAEATPSFTCPVGRNTCDTPVYTNPEDPTGPKIDLPDPVTNFMDYSYDSCMRMFTAGQHAVAAWRFKTYRYGR